MRRLLWFNTSLLLRIESVMSIASNFPNITDMKGICDNGTEIIWDIKFVGVVSVHFENHYFNNINLTQWFTLDIKFWMNLEKKESSTNNNNVSDLDQTYHLKEIDVRTGWNMLRLHKIVDIP